MAYKFKLEPVLNYRRNLEELAQQKLVSEQQVLKHHRERLARLQTEREQMIADFERRKKEAMPASLFAFHVNGIGRKEGEIQVQKNLVASQRQVVERAREDLHEKVKARKVIERARERDYQKYMKEYLRKEQNASDELAVLRFGRDTPRG